MKTLFYNARLVDANTDSMGGLFVEDGRIQKVLLGDCTDILNDSSVEKVDVQGKVLMPSFIDMHVHLRNPGQEEKETIESFLNAAVAGGFGLLVAMPNTNPVISDVALAHSIQDSVAHYEMAELIQSITLTRDFNGVDTSHIDNATGILLITEDGKDVASSAVMLEAMLKASKYNMVVTCHSEDASFTDLAKNLRAEAIGLLKGLPANQWASVKNADRRIDECLRKAHDYLALAEDLATERNIFIAQKAMCKVHIAHASTKKTIEIIRRWKKEGNVNVTCEITPHHFSLSSDEEGFLRYLVNPPIRNTIDRDSLVEAIIDGTCDVIATDHAPHTMADKDTGAPGFSGLETSFAVSNTELVVKNNISISKLSSLMSANAAKILGYDDRGLLQKGMQADLVIVDTDFSWIVDSSQFKTQGKVCPFEGKTVKGKVLQTWYKGKKVFEA